MIGRRLIDIPGARIRKTVTMKLIAPSGGGNAEKDVGERVKVDIEVRD